VRRENISRLLKFERIPMIIFISTCNFANAFSTIVEMLLVRKFKTFACIPNHEIKQI
jgi:hypothetical protein